MNVKAQTLILVLAAASLSGCVIAVNDGEDWDSDNRWRKQESRNKEAIGKLRIGQNLETTVREMGEPDISEAVQRGGKEYRVYYYRVREIHSDNTTTKDEATPLVFVDGVLTGWGDAALAQMDQ